MTAEIVLPGDEIPPSLLPASQNPNKPLTLGPGLRHIPPSTITTTVAGALSVDGRKNAIWVEHNGGRVLVTVHHSAPEMYLCAITPHTPLATLPHLAFEGATKKTRPMLSPGALVYARVSAASKHMDPELECLSATTGKADDLGPLKGGMVFDVGLSMARRLLMPGGRRDATAQGGPGRVVVLEELAEKVRFEVAVGRNGRVWVDSEEGVKVVLAVGSALVETDERGLGVEGQRELVAKLLKRL